jgi:dinuclear metal center YbgI/SA1388 family protein
VKIKEIIAALENWAPKSFQESYDNSGLIVGDAQAEVSKCLVSLDCIEAVVDEAIEKGAELIVSHHPIVFSGLKSLTGMTYVERVIIKAIQNNIAIYAIHTNLDNVNTGVNYKIAEKLKLKNVKVLAPTKGLLKKLVTFVPVANIESVKDALFKAGAGHIGNYSECSFQTEGEGNFKAEVGADPFVGKIEERHTEKEERLEVVLTSDRVGSVIHALNSSHPYEEVAYDLYPLENTIQTIGSGMIGELETSLNESGFLAYVKTNLKTDCIRHTAFTHKEVKTVAFCGGSGSFLLGQAMGQKADAFITGDFKYHEFFDADGKLMILDVGHFESEQFTIDLIAEKIQENFPIFAVLKTGIDTNPISYYK